MMCKINQKVNGGVFSVIKVFDFRLWKIVVHRSELSYILTLKLQVNFYSDIYVTLSKNYL